MTLVETNFNPLTLVGDLLLDRSTTELALVNHHPTMQTWVMVELCRLINSLPRTMLAWATVNNQHQCIPPARRTTTTLVFMEVCSYTFMEQLCQSLIPTFIEPQQAYETPPNFGGGYGSYSTTAPGGNAPAAYVVVDKAERFADAPYYRDILFMILFYVHLVGLIVRFSFHCTSC